MAISANVWKNVMERMDVAYVFVLAVMDPLAHVTRTIATVQRNVVLQQSVVASVFTINPLIFFAQ